MISSEKITILLTDEDALRRDGLAAVLRAIPNFEVIAQCPDGEAALKQIRQLRPAVAVVDLNLPKLHGIELVRRVRAEGLEAKIVILSGSTDDDIIREVVRAGGDACLLKNGPARHLIDAISYVLDGGRYFSPQLRRDGLDRHLLEEKPLLASERLRERLRENSRTENLAERDYEILDMMAEGIRPMLDRFDEIEIRVVEMETGEALVPANVRGWLNNQIADTLQDSRSPGRDVALGGTFNDLEARLPQLIEEAVTSRFHNMAGKLQQEIEDTHVRTLETFVKNIQVKLVRRVSALETDMSKQAEAMNQLREYSERTEDNLSRLISGVDRLAQELPKRLAAPQAASLSAPDPQPGWRRKTSRAFSPKVFWITVAAILIIVLAAFQVPKLLNGRKSVDSTAGSAADPSAPSKPVAPPAGADTKTMLQAAGEYTERKNYTMAEGIYKQVLKAEPNNVDAMTALASVLYREDKIEESAAILDKLPKTN